MTKTQALQNFWESFGIPAYPVTSVPDDMVFPWLTYEVSTSDFGGGDVYTAVELWFYGESEAPANKKAEEIGQKIGLGGCTVSCDDGIIWIKKGSPWMQTIKDEVGNEIKRKKLNVTYEFLTY